MYWFCYSFKIFFSEISTFANIRKLGSLDSVRIATASIRLTLLIWMHVVKRILMSFSSLLYIGSRFKFCMYISGLTFFCRKMYIIIHFLYRLVSTFKTRNNENEEFLRKTIHVFSWLGLLFFFYFRSLTVSTVDFSSLVWRAIMNYMFLKKKTPK